MRAVCKGSVNRDFHGSNGSAPGGQDGSATKERQDRGGADRGAHGAASETGGEKKLFLSLQLLFDLNMFIKFY